MAIEAGDIGASTSCSASTGEPGVDEWGPIERTDLGRLGWIGGQDPFPETNCPQLLHSAGRGWLRSSSAAESKAARIAFFGKTGVRGDRSTDNEGSTVGSPAKI